MKPLIRQGRIQIKWTTSIKRMTNRIFIFIFPPFNNMSTHQPGLPQGTILDPLGKPVQVCIPWQTWRTLLRHADAPSTPATRKPTPVPTTAPATENKQGKTRLPPGVVLDENGKPCKVCNSWQTWAKVTKKPRTSTQSPASSTTPIGSSIGTAVAAVTGTTEKKTNETGEPKRPDDCPPDVNTLGRATWTFLHTTAAYYPPTATPAQQSSMRALIHAVGEFYPCTWCAKDFRDRIAEHAPDVSGRAGLSTWMCERHNEVNKRLGKEVFDCALVMERWKDGPADGRCD